MSSKVVHIFLSYAPEDIGFRQKLEAQLIPLVMQGRVDVWHDGMTLPGSDSYAVRAARLTAADVVLLLVSPSFIASDRCWNQEMKNVIQRYDNKTLRVVPVLLRPCAWESTPFGQLEPLPPDRKPVTSCSDRDQALLEVGEGVRKVVEHLESVAPPEPETTAPPEPETTVPPEPDDPDDGQPEPTGALPRASNQGKSGTIRKPRPLSQADISAIEPDRREQILSYLPTYLIFADRMDQLSRLLMDFSFMEAKISRLGIRELVKDYDALFDLAGKHLPAEIHAGCLEWIRAILKRSADDMLKDASQLAKQLLRHPPRDKVPGVEQVLAQARQRVHP